MNPTEATVNQPVRESGEEPYGSTIPEADAVEFERLSRLANGNSRGWKFDRDEIRDRR